MSQTARELKSFSDISTNPVPQEGGKEAVSSSHHPTRALQGTA
nr:MULTISPECIES: hypothetical protein [unclassified Streptomyces]